MGNHFLSERGKLMVICRFLSLIIDQGISFEKKGWPRNKKWSSLIEIGSYWSSPLPLKIQKVGWTWLIHVQLGLVWIAANQLNGRWTFKDSREVGKWLEEVLNSHFSISTVVRRSGAIFELSYMDLSKYQNCCIWTPMDIGMSTDTCRTWLDTCVSCVASG